jgi:hypothetical protein
MVTNNKISTKRGLVELKKSWQELGKIERELQLSSGNWQEIG